MNRVELPASDIRERGRDCYQRRLWVDAFAAFSQADQIEPLAAADLCLLAWSAHLSGRDEDFARAMGRAYRLPRRRRTLGRGPLRRLARHHPGPQRRSRSRSWMAEPRRTPRCTRE